MINVFVNDETSPLRAVILGTAKGVGDVPLVDDAYDPKSKEHIAAGTYPKEADMVKEIEAFAKVLEKYNVKIYRPEIIEDYNQIFSRDIGFVIENKFIKPRILKDRKEEIKGIQYILEQINPDQIVTVPENVRVEGGDVMPWKDHLFVGYSEKEDFEEYIVARTNRAGLEFLANEFPNKKVKGFQLNKSDEVAKDNALHLDCCFQPIGENQAIIYKGGFKLEEDYNYLKDYFGEENLIHITRDEMYEMNSNVFSISPKVIVLEENFSRLAGILEERGYTVEKVPYSEISKMEGLLRCSTLPLERAQ
ncbi:dimethylarginine dimethylaminohydrolase family protein [Marivirga sp.]|uniref:dimethylarginine dimethylaminohydrolase family protein n=1 Tax=Marivirga sp. TaxID=2018662 RepID=UPI002D7EF3F7|nr:arginine deiminase family protein [Marivirga sp.]HET8860286.1 arginine deiminase family protein [Marivirga sp.]